MRKPDKIPCHAKDCAFREETGYCSLTDVVIGPDGHCVHYRGKVAGELRRSKLARRRPLPGDRSITYRLEMVSCGKCDRCREGPSHGPYWYAYWKENGRTRSRYMGKGKTVQLDEDDDMN